MGVTNLNPRWGRPMAGWLVPFALVREEGEDEEAKGSGGSASVTMYEALVNFVDAYSTGVSIGSLGRGVLNVSSLNSWSRQPLDL
jgi:hypothetical protein